MSEGCAVRGEALEEARGPKIRIPPLTRTRSSWFFDIYLYQYFINDKKIKNLLFASFFIGFGCGVRLPFIVLVFPIILCGFVYLFNKYKSQYLNLFNRLSLHFLIAFLNNAF